MLSIDFRYRQRQTFIIILFNIILLYLSLHLIHLLDPKSP